MIKFLFTLALFAVAAFAQNAEIGLPQKGATVTAGDSLVVQVQRPNSLTGSEEVAVVVGFQSCSSGRCVSPSDYMGSILYNGPFNPQYHEQNLPPYENFTVQVPSSAASGTAIIGVAHVTLVGAGLYPFMEVLNQTITVA